MPCESKQIELRSNSVCIRESVCVCSCYPSVKSWRRGSARVEYCPTCRTTHLRPSTVMDALLLLLTCSDSCCRMFTSSVERKVDVYRPWLHPDCQTNIPPTAMRAVLAYRREGCPGKQVECRNIWRNAALALITALFCIRMLRSVNGTFG